MATRTRLWPIRPMRQLGKLQGSSSIRPLFPLAHNSLSPNHNSATRRHSSSIPYQTPPDEPTLAQLPDLDASKLTIHETTTPKILTDPQSLIFGHTFTDHMLTAEWTAKTGWDPPRIIPYQNFSLDPASTVLHYAFTCFEGLKAYKDASGRLRLFRPDMNMARLNRSAQRIALPRFDEQQGTELLKRFCALEDRHIPDTKGFSLYLRPTLISTQRTLGVGPPGSALLYLIACPVGPYYASGFKAISLQASSRTVRAWPGGVGDKKLGANYAPCIVPQMEAAAQGFTQNLWLFRDESPAGGGEEFVTEVGMMNLFAAFRHADGSRELVTAPLDGTILEGVTRDSILALARDRLPAEGWTVSERRFTMREVAEASASGRLLEVFGAGTAAVVSPVRVIDWHGRSVHCALPEGEETGPLARRFKAWIEAIQYGEEEFRDWSVVV